MWEQLQRRACQENAIALHKTCSAPLPQQWLKSCSPWLSQYCHIAASTGVLPPWRGSRGAPAPQGRSSNPSMSFTVLGFRWVFLFLLYDPQEQIST